MWCVAIKSTHNIIPETDKEFIVNLIDYEIHKVWLHKLTLHEILEEPDVCEAIIEGHMLALFDLVSVLRNSLPHKLSINLTYIS